MRSRAWFATAAVPIAFVIAVVLMGAGNPVADMPLTTQGARTGEVSFGDLATDALCDEAGTAIAFMPAVAFKTGTIKTGPFNLAAVARLLQMPSENWAVSSLKGQQIKAALERSLSRLPLPSGAFLQVSGLTVAYDPNAPRNHRIKQILVAGAPLDEAKTYEVAMPVSLAKGGAGYFQIFDAKNIVRQGSKGLAQVIFDFAKKRGHVSYTGQGRIVPTG